MIQHEGEEFGYVLEGEIELNVAGRPYRLNKGDTFHFRSERAHSYRNVGRKKARVLWTRHLILTCCGVTTLIPFSGIVFKDLDRLRVTAACNIELITSLR